MVNPELRRLGSATTYVTPVALGCWPISGMTSLDVNEADSLATLHAAIDAGLNFFDTADAYGASGESERLIARATAGRRDKVVIATKGGIAWGASGGRVIDGRPETLRRQCDESLRRLGTDRVELLYLHAPDPYTPLAESAGELRRLMEEGKTLSVGVSNFSLPQLAEFHAVCPLSAFQPPYNMLQRDIERDSLPLVPRAEHLGLRLLAAPQGAPGRQTAAGFRLSAGGRPGEVSDVPGRRMATEPGPAR